SLNEREKAILKIWFYKNREHQYYLEKAFTNLDKHLKEIEGVAVDELNSPSISLTVVSNNGLAEKGLSDVEITNPDGVKRTVKFKVIRKSQVQKSSNYYGLYDPQVIFGG
ncbi:MAG: hypothetical protein KKF65_01915, partial [Nanoarchaeota archaeon]|nr:hypothetical protein [Nanoarchaeota archaeon]